MSDNPAPDNPAPDNALVFDDVSVVRGGRLIWSEGTFTIPAGGIVAVIGSNGSGKSTLLQVILGLLPVGVGRGAWAAVAAGVSFLRQQLQALMILEQRPVAPPGALALTRLLSAEDLALLAALAAPPATRDGGIAGSLALAEAFLPRARRLASAAGAPWPQELEAAVRGHLARELGLTLPA